MDEAPSYTHGDTAPPLDVELYRERRPVILDPADTVEATILRPGLANLVRPAVVEDLGDGTNPAVVRITWQAGDLDNPGPDPVEYRARLVITTAAGVESTPAPPRFRVLPVPA